VTLPLSCTVHVLVLISTGSDQFLNPSQGVDNFYLEFLILFPYSILLYGVQLVPKFALTTQYA